MFKLDFECQSCKHLFTTIDEYQIVCPECKSIKVIVVWYDKDKPLDVEFKGVDRTNTILKGDI